MALPTLIGNDGRKAVIAFTGADTVRRWRADARPVPVPAARLWPAVAAEQADAVVIDVAGPVPLVIEGARLRALASGAPPPLPHEDPDIRAQVAAVTGEFTLEPGGPDADLAVTLKTGGPGRRPRRRRGHRRPAGPPPPPRHSGPHRITATSAPRRPDPPAPRPYRPRQSVPV